MSTLRRSVLAVAAVVTALPILAEGFGTLQVGSRTVTDRVEDTNQKGYYGAGDLSISVDPGRVWTAGLTARL